MPRPHTDATSARWWALLGDRFGRRRLLPAALIVFGLASFWCAHAGSASELIVARTVLGTATAFRQPLAASVFLVLFPGRAERQKATAPRQSTSRSRQTLPLRLAAHAKRIDALLHSFVELHRLLGRQPARAFEIDYGPVEIATHAASE